MDFNKQYYTIQPLTPGYNSWQQDSKINQQIITDSNITSSWKYRQYMQNNASHIMKYNTMEYIYASGNNPYTVLNKTPTNSNPYLFNSIHDSSNQYPFIHNSDLKNNYLKKEQINSRMISPCIPTTNFN